MEHVAMKQIERWEDHMEGRERREDRIVRCTCTGAGPDPDCKVGARIGEHPRECYLDDSDATLRFADGRTVDRDRPVRAAEAQRPNASASDHRANMVMIAQAIVTGHGGKALYTDPEDAHTLARAVLAYVEARPADGGWAAVAGCFAGDGVNLANAVRAFLTDGDRDALRAALVRFETAGAAP
jgi:hypothetical protein